MGRQQKSGLEKDGPRCSLANVHFGNWILASSFSPSRLHSLRRSRAGHHTLPGQGLRIGTLPRYRHRDMTLFQGSRHNIVYGRQAILQGRSRQAATFQPIILPHHPNILLPSPSDIRYALNHRLKALPSTRATYLVWASTSRFALLPCPQNLLSTVGQRQTGRMALQTFYLPDPASLPLLYRLWAISAFTPAIQNY